MIIEGLNIVLVEIDCVLMLEMCWIINDEDKIVLFVVECVLLDIVVVIDVIYVQVSGGGCLIYFGVGIFGCLGILDVSECLFIYGVKLGLVVGLIVGGEYVIQYVVEGVEDSWEGGVNDLKNINLMVQDVVVGIVVSGCMLYVIVGLEYVCQFGCCIVGIFCNLGSVVLIIVEFVIILIVGVEVVIGFLWMKVGIVQKLVFNMFFIGLMIKFGKVFGNLMVDVVVINEKLYV